MAVNDGSLVGFPFVNFAMEMRGTQTEGGQSRSSIVYPRRKFTFLVEFFVNVRALNPNRLQTDLPNYLQNGRLLATLKSIDHPKPTLKTEKFNSYNKKVILPTGTEYAPSTMTFHDDNTSIAMALWREYRSYYQGEGIIGTQGVINGQLTSPFIEEFRQGNSLIGDNVRVGMDRTPSLGMTIRPNDGRHFFDAIRLYDLGSDPDSVNVYTYLYPVITALDHDSLDYEDRSSSMGLSMTFDYEGYYHLVGLNNFAFQEVLQQQFGFSATVAAPRVQGHAIMNPGNPTDDGEEGAVPALQGLLNSLNGVIGSSTDNLSFANVAPVGRPTSPVVVNPLAGSPFSASEIADLLKRTAALE